jgi:hypothetical protein
MTLTRIILRLARNPGYPEGDDGQGYIITAPLDRQGHLDLAEWQKARDACSVVRFKPGDDRDADGKLTHRGGKWMFHYDEKREGDDEPVYRLGDHNLSIGSYVTIHESDGRDLTYRVAGHLGATQRQKEHG